MAIKIYEKYSPRANAPTVEYPVGSIKNESIPGANDGTPLDQEWGNDYAGFDGALFGEVGITPNGISDTAILSQRLDAIKSLIGGISSPAFNTIEDMAGGITSKGSVIEFRENMLLQTPTTAWRVKTSGSGVALNGGLTAVPLNTISIESFGGGEDVADNSQALLDADALFATLPANKRIIRIESDIVVDTDPLVLPNTVIHLSELATITKSGGGNPEIFTSAGSILGQLQEQSFPVNRVGYLLSQNISNAVPQTGDTSTSVMKIERNTEQTSDDPLLLGGAALETLSRVGFGNTCTATTPTQLIGMEVRNVGTPVGRVELNAITSYMNCIPNNTQQNINLYNDWVMITPKSANAADRTAFAAAHAVIAKKLAPGLGVDADHDGEYGMTIQTKCGTVGFESDPDSINAESYPLDAGILLNGWSGDPATVSDGHSASANAAFSNAIRIGGRGGVWTKLGNSKIQNGIVMSDYAGVGLFFGSRHPDGTGKAIDVSSGAGESQFQTKTTFSGSGGVFMPDIPNGIANASQFQLYRDGDVIKIKLTA